MDLFAASDLCTPWCIRVAATLRVAEHIAAGDTAVEAIAHASGAHPESLHRVLRHLAQNGFFAETAPGVFALNDAARELLHEGARISLDLDGFGGRMASPWATLLKAVRTGRPAYEDVFGRPFWDDLQAHPEIAAQFDALMGPAGHGTPDPEILLDPSGWDTVRTVVDVGGGTGTLLAEILKARPSLRGILVDLPHTVERARGAFEKVGQSFFDPLPPGAGIYVLKNVLSDWPDEQATALLRRCAEAARPTGRVVILGGVAPEEPGPELLMLVLVGGKSRSLAEFGELARRAGLVVQAAARQTSGRFVVECVTAPEANPGT